MYKVYRFRREWGEEMWRVDLERSWGKGVLVEELVVGFVEGRVCIDYYNVRNRILVIMYGGIMEW